MRLRVVGTRAERAAAVGVLRLGFAVREMSAWLPNRGDSVLGRVYVEATALTDTGLSDTESE